MLVVAVVIVSFLGHCGNSEPSILTTTYFIFPLLYYLYLFILKLICLCLLSPSPIYQASLLAICLSFHPLEEVSSIDDPGVRSVFVLLVDCV